MNLSDNEEIRNPKLVAAMQAMLKHDNEQTRSQMAAELLDSRLLSPVQQQTILTEQSGPAKRVRFMDIKNTEGDKYYLAFTGLDEYAKWNDEDKHNEAMIMTLDDFGNILIRQLNGLKGFVVNPYGENISISKDLLLSLLKQREAKMEAERGN